MSARLALTVLLTLSLLLSGSVWAHGPMPGNIDSTPYIAADSAMMAPVDATTANGADPSGDAPQSGGNCDHHGDQPSTPAVDDDTSPPTRTAPGNPHGCCTDGNCSCPPPIGKGMAIGPAHLASHGSPAPYAPVSTPASMDPYQSLLRPPIP